MATFAMYCTDKADTAQKRLDARDTHFAHIENILDDIRVAGPLNAADGTTIGSLLIVEAENEDAARALLEQDPYFSADIWSDIRITQFIPAAGKWIGGKIW